MTIPKAFISYSWDDETHKAWVRDFATRLRHDGVETTLDQWHTAPGDQLPAFMDRAIRENDFVLIICTPGYKLKYEARQGGVGYEGDVLQGHVFVTHNHRKFIPLLRNGEWQTAAPSELYGKRYIDFHGGDFFESHYQELLRTLRGELPVAPAVGSRYIPANDIRSTERAPAQHKYNWRLGLVWVGVLVLACAVGWGKYSYDRRTTDAADSKTSNPGSPQQAATTDLTVAPTLQPKLIGTADTKTEPERNAEGLKAMKERLGELKVRAGVKAKSWQQVIESLEKGNQSLQPGIATALALLKSYTERAEGALNRGDAITAKRDMDLADEQIQFLDRQNPE